MTEQAQQPPKPDVSQCHHFKIKFPWKVSELPGNQNRTVVAKFWVEKGDTLRRFGTRLDRYLKNVEGRSGFVRHVKVYTDSATSEKTGFEIAIESSLPHGMNHDLHEMFQQGVLPELHANCLYAEVTHA